MANTFNNPMILDTDFTSYRTAASKTIGIRVLKITLSVGSTTTSAGTVVITNPQNSQQLYPSVPVAAAIPANSILVGDNPTGQGVMSWPDFGVSGLTATGTKLYIWWGL
jgi:hypothetical protein